MHFPNMTVKFQKALVIDAINFNVA